MAFLRATLDGPNGSGKTCTTALLAAALAKELGGDVHVFDSSNRWRTWKKIIFDPEKIRLVIHYGESIAVLQDAVAAATNEQAAVFVGDDLTVPWLEGVESFSQENGNLTFGKRSQLLAEWNEFVNQFKHGRFDALACGRRGYIWENVENDEGLEELRQGDPKFNAGGGQNFGYDADLELTIRRRERKILRLFRGKITVDHIVDVRKDAHSQLSGRQFVFPEWEDGYTVGAYKPVLDALRPHIAWVRSLDDVQFNGKSSRGLIVNGQTDWARDQAKRKGLLEELGANLDLCFPAGEGRSKLAKMCRDLTLEYLNGFMSWSRMEEETPTQMIEQHVLILQALRKRIEAGEMVPPDPAVAQVTLKVLLDCSTEDVLHPGRHVSLLEAMGLRSVESVGRKTAGKVA